MKVQNAKSGKKARIEIIPLIDVIMFLLATFVLFTLTMNKTQTIDMKLPASTPTDKPPETKPEAIGIDANGGFFLNKRQVTWEDLVQYVIQVKRDKGDAAAFLIQGEEQADFGLAVQLLDEARKQDIKGMSIDTNAKKSVH